MRGRSLYIAMVAFAVVIAIGCSSGGGNPLAPAGSDITAGSAVQAGQVQTHLWGYYDVYVDIPSKTATAVPNRSVMFAANVVDFVNGNPANLGFLVKGTPMGADYIDVDIDVTIKHPFPGLVMYNGYDVRGVFMGNGHGTLHYSSKLKYPKFGVDQFEMNNPIPGESGGPDGYTRWFNKPEFTTPGLFGYTPGLFASPGYSPTATLNPYKYFADGLGLLDDAATWLKANPATNGVFSAGSACTRNYYLRFPTPTPNVVFAYGIVASWKGEAPEDHPANATETVACSMGITPDVYYTGPTTWGGSIIADFTLINWAIPPASIIVESTVLTAGNYELSPDEMVPTDSGVNYSSYHVEIAATMVTGITGNEIWFIAKYTGYNYKNTFGVPNLAGNDPLAAFFRYDLPVLNNVPPVCDLQVVTPMPAGGWGPQGIQFDASGSVDPGDTLTFTWDFDGDGVYSEPVDDAYTGSQDKPTHTYSASYVGQVFVKTTDTSNVSAECVADIDVTVAQTKNVNCNNTAGLGLDVALDPVTGDVLVLYDNGTVRRYLYSTFLTTFKTPVTNLGSVLYTKVAVGPQGYWFGAQVSGGAITHHYSPADTSISTMTWPQVGGNIPMVCDIASMYNVGTRANDHGITWGYYNFTTEYHYLTSPSGWMDTAFNTGWQLMIDSIISNGAGASVLYYGWIRGVAADPTGDRIWYLEYNDCLASKWDVSGVAPVYANNYWGVSMVPTDGDGGTNNPKDIAVSKSNHYFVLDRLGTGSYKIKGFTDNGTSTTSLTSFVQTPTWAQTPVRIDGDPALGRLVVLMAALGNTSISLFESTELP